MKKYLKYVLLLIVTAGIITACIYIYNTNKLDTAYNDFGSTPLAPNLQELEESENSEVEPEIIPDPSDYLDLWSYTYVKNACRAIMKEYNDNGPFVFNTDVAYIDNDVDKLRVEISTKLNKYFIDINIATDEYNYYVAE